MDLQQNRADASQRPTSHRPRRITWAVAALATALFAACTTAPGPKADELLARAKAKRLAGEMSEAYALFTSPPLADNAEALFLAASMQQGGQGTPADEAQALGKLLRADGMGYRNAANNIASIYLEHALHEHEQAPASCEKALFYLDKAQSAPNAPSALLNLAFMNLHGWCVAQDVPRAVALYERSARAGNHSAAQALARLYGDGTYLPVDPAKADY